MEDLILEMPFEDDVIGHFIILKDALDVTNAFLAIIAGFLVAFSFFAFVFMRRR